MTLFLQTIKFLLRREAAYIVIKKISFSILIVLITSELYELRYGIYQIDLSITHSFISSHFGKFSFSVIIFMSLFLLSYLFETRFLPLLGVIFIGKYSPATIKPFKNKINKYIFRIAPKEEMKEAMRFMNENKFEYYVYISFLPNIMLLFFIWLSLAFSLWFLLFTPLITLYLIKQALNPRKSRTFRKALFGNRKINFRIHTRNAKKTLNIGLNGSVKRSACLSTF